MKSSRTTNANQQQAASVMEVLLIDNEPQRAKALIESLNGQGYRVLDHLENSDRLSHHVKRLRPDVVIIDMDHPDRDTLESMAVMHRDHPRPVVFFAEADSDSLTIKAAVSAGVSAYIADGLKPDRVRPIIDSAIAQFEQFQSLRQQLDQTRTKLADRSLVDKAKGLLMKHQSCDEEQAYSTLRKLSMDRSQRIAEVAIDVIHILQRL